jgi:hypothetical protein
VLFVAAIATEGVNSRPGTTDGTTALVLAGVAALLAWPALQVAGVRLAGATALLAPWTVLALGWLAQEATGARHRPALAFVVLPAVGYAAAAALAVALCPRGTALPPRNGR